MEGTGGTEKVSISLDNYFQKAMTTIYSWGGDVLKFCGDALLCIFETGSNDTPLNVCTNAMMAGLELKEKLMGYKAAEGVILDLKLMLSFGKITGYYIGR